MRRLSPPRFAAATFRLHWGRVAAFLALLILLIPFQAAASHNWPSALHPWKIVTGSDGNLWFTSKSCPITIPGPSVCQGLIGRMTPTGVLTVFPTAINSEPTHLGDIAAGPDGNLWFNAGFGVIGRITPQGAVTGFSARHNSQELTAGPDGNVWFTDDFGMTSTEVFLPAISRVTPQGAVTRFPTGLDASFTIRGIAAGVDGNLWFTATGPTVAAIGRITPQGVVTMFSLSGLTGVLGIAAGADGNLWFTATGAGGRTIGRITPQGDVTTFATGLGELGRIAAGPDGNLWFTATTANPRVGAIGRITPEGTVTTFSAVVNNFVAVPLDIAAGPDGNLWFTDSLNASIKRMTPAGVVTLFDPCHPGPLIDCLGLATGPPAAVAPGPLQFKVIGLRVRKVSVTIRVSCPSTARRACTGIATLLAPPRRKGAKAVRIGRTSFSVASGRKKTLTVRLNAAGRSRLSKAKLLRATLRISAKDGGGRSRLVLRKVRFSSVR